MSQKVNTKLAVAIASGLSIRRAAAAAGVSARTATRRAADSAFREEVDAIRREALGRAVARLTVASNKAAALLVKQMRNDDPGVAQRAAIAVWRVGRDGRNEQDLEQRLAEVERRLGEDHR